MKLFVEATPISGPTRVYMTPSASRLTLDPLTFGAVLLSSVTVNAGNYGIPLNQFAFGTQAVSRAAVYYLATLVVTYVGGAVVGAGGGGFQHAAHRILRLPVVYAGLVGVAFNTGGVALPEPVMRAAHLLATAAAPVMLTLLGIELSRAYVRHGEPALVAACALKLLVAPLLAFGLAWTMGLEGVTRNVAIVQSSMPTAVGFGVE